MPSFSRGLSFLRTRATSLALLMITFTFGIANADFSKIDPRARAAAARMRGGSTVPEAREAGAAVTETGMLDVFIRGSVSRATLEAYGARVRTELPGLFTADLPLGALESVAALADVISIRGTAPAEPNLNSSIVAIGANTARGAGPAFAGTNGAGILVADVDSGIDFDHGDFKTAGGQTRLVNIWDQTFTSTPPAGYSYGTEWSAAQIDGGLCTETDPIGNAGHGSHVLGIAGGDGSQTGAGAPAYTYAGVAPMADLLMVKTDFSTTHVVDGVAYAMSRAAARGQNASVNLSLGTQFGPHDGTSDFETALTALTGAGRILTVSAGNDRATDRHAKLFALGAGDSAKLTVSGGTTNGRLLAIDGYYESTENLNITIRTPGNFFIGPITLSNANAAYPGQTTGVNGRVYVENGLFLTTTGAREVYFELTSLGAGAGSINGTWTFYFNPVSLGAANGRVDLWRFFTSTTALVNTFTLKQSNDVLVSEPGNANGVITVAAWVTKNSWIDCGGRSVTYTNPPAVGTLAPFSSPGPTRDGRQKPDIAAPGMGIASARSFDFVNNCPATASLLINDGPPAQHIINQGTSMAAPHVTGTAALLLQRNGAMTPDEVKSYLFSHATIDGNTGAPWNLDWGNGKLNVGDLSGPVVTVMSPNGGESLVQCSTVALTWSATDAGGVANVDLQLSRGGPGGPFEDLALAIPNSGSYSWTVTGPSTSNGFLKVTARDLVGNVGSDLSNAAFSIASPTITATAGSGGTISPSGVVVVACGSDQTFTIAADGCHTIGDVVVDGSSVGPVGTYTFTNVQGNHTIAASFTPIAYTITASAGPNGTISPSGAVSVGCGASQSFAITPAPCYSVADVLVDGISVGAVTSYTFTNVQANHSIDASFVFNTYTITASAGANGTITPSGAVPVSCGADQSFAITADACYHVADVLVDGVSVGAVTSYTFTNVTADHTIAASFALTTYTIAASAGAGGTISPSGPVSMGCGADQSFAIAADACYSIQDVLVDGVSVGPVTSYTFTNVTADHTIAASFALHAFTITASAGANGTISPSGAVPVDCGADQSFAIAPAACYSVADVLVDGASVGAVTNYTFTNVQADHTIDASFVFDSYTITASAGPGGTITPSGAVSVSCGADQSFAIAPNAGYSIIDVVVDGSSVGPVATYTFTNVQANHTISASFADVTPPVVTVTFPNGGEVMTIGGGGSAPMTWTATDEVGVTSVDLFVSRTGVGGPYEAIATGVPNTGTYDWVVTPPGTNLGPDPEYTAFFRVVATDGSNTGTDESDAGFAIFQPPPGAVLVTFQADPGADGIVLRWELAGPETFVETRLERGDSETGPWLRIDAERQTQGVVTSAVDRTAVAGRAYWYRLIARTSFGQEMTFGPIPGRSADRIVEFALTRIDPNPSRGLVRMDFTVPKASSVRLSVVDVQGREIAVVAEGPKAPGRYSAVWAGETIRGGQAPTGVYFVRYQAAGARHMRRLVLTR